MKTSKHTLNAKTKKLANKLIKAQTEERKIKITIKELEKLIKEEAEKFNFRNTDRAVDFTLDMIRGNDDVKIVE